MIDALEQARIRGERARQIIEDEVFVSAFAAIEADLTSAWRNSGVADSDAREDAYRMLRALDAVRADLTRVMVDGVMAADEVEQRKRDAAIAAFTHGV